MLNKFIIFIFSCTLLFAQNLKYDYSSKALYKPQMLPIFQGYPRKINLSEDDLNLSLKNSWWFSNLSHLAYFDKNRIKKELKKIGLKFEVFYDVEGTQLFIASSNNFVIVSFRGTQIEERIDLETDIDAIFTSIGDGLEVHRGFYKAYSKVKELIIKRVRLLKKRGYKIYYTGHSLGGAIATFLAYDLKPTALYTFGSPMVGNKKFTNSLKDCKIYRFVNGCDIVPTLPSIMSSYSHIGKLIFFDYQGKVFIEPSILTQSKRNFKAFIEYTKKMPLFRKNYLLFRSLADHSIYNYTISISRNIK